MDWTPEELQAIVDEHALVLFMKGTPDQAQCGFSNRAAQVMQALGEPFAAVNILTDPRAIPSVCTWSDFPTMPQVFVHGELIGGSDIALEMLNDGSLREMFDAGISQTFSSYIIKPLTYDGTLVRSGRYSFSFPAWDTIENHDQESIVAIGSSLTQYAINGNCIF